MKPPSLGTLCRTCGEDYGDHKRVAEGPPKCPVAVIPWTPDPRFNADWGRVVPSQRQAHAIANGLSRTRANVRRLLVGVGVIALLVTCCGTSEPSAAAPDGAPTVTGPRCGRP